MLERTSTTQDVPTAAEAITANGQAGLEQRVRRLEDAVASLQDTGPLEDRIVERVTTRLEPGAVPKRGSTHERTGEGRKLVPALWQDTGADATGEETSSPPPLGTWRGLWILFEAYTEARTMVRMFFDRRYRPSWLARVGPVLLVVAIATSWYWLPGTSIALVGSLWDKSVDLILAFLAFRILSWEVRRYRAVLANQGISPG